MKRVLALLLLAVIIAITASGCAQVANSECISIVCTLFPQYDWIRSIVGDSDRISVTLLIQNGTDPHSYQPTAADVLTISNCDMIVYVDGDSDLWVKEALERSKNTDTVKVGLSKIEGMTLHPISSHSHTHGEDGEHSDHSDHSDHNDHDEHSAHGHGVFDEHLWLSLRNAQTAVSHLTDAICALDRESEAAYRANAEKYLEGLAALDAEYRAAVDSAAEEDRFLLFADRFPFVYLLSDYGVEYSAAFEGCTTDVDAGFDTVLGLIKEAEEHAVRYIAVTETSDMALASTVASSASEKEIEILVMNSLQSVTRAQIASGLSYLSVMEENLVALRTALGVSGE